MRDYRVYFLDPNGHICRAELLRCLDDLEALAQGERLSCDAALEIWEGARIVARVKLGNAELASDDRQCL